MPRVPASACPTCGTGLDAAADIHDPDALPSPGDPTLCLHCGDLLVFTPSRSVRRPTVFERAELMALPEVRQAVDQIASFRASRQN